MLAVPALLGDVSEAWEFGPAPVDAWVVESAAWEQAPTPQPGQVWRFDHAGIGAIIWAGVTESGEALGGRLDHDQPVLLVAPDPGDTHVTALPNDAVTQWVAALDAGAILRVSLVPLESVIETPPAGGAGSAEPSAAARARSAEINAAAREQARRARPDRSDLPAAERARLRAEAFAAHGIRLFGRS